MNAIWDAFTNPILDGPGALVAHLRMSLLALAIATVIGGALGIVGAKSGSRMASLAISTIANVGRTVPTFPLMALVVALSSLGEGPAVVSLVVLGIPPVMLNAFTAIAGVDRAVVEAARGVGFTGWGILTRVELPLSLPLITAGVRIAAVQIVATAVFAGAVGGGGLGVLILAGLANSDSATLLAGAIPTAAVALLASLILGLAERALTPRGLRRRRADRVRRPLAAGPAAG